MPHNRRHLVSGDLYALAIRVKDGLPFTAASSVRLILEGCMARAQANDKIILCHYVWMTNHAHMLFLIKDPYEATKFYGETQKKITDSYKALLGEEELKMWAGDPVVARIDDLEAAIEQVVYLYANPSRANLVSTIKDYPGLSSWNLFNNAKNTIKACVQKEANYVPASKVLQLPSRKLSERSDAFFHDKLLKLAQVEHLKIYPNLWMAAFGIDTDQEVAEVNESIHLRLRMREDEHAKIRRGEGKTVLGIRALIFQEICKPFQRKRYKAERRVFIVASDSQSRINYIKHFKEACEYCTQCFIKMLSGITVEWPPGFFRPALRHSASAICSVL